MGKNANLLLASQNPARGNEGACGGDSGGPLFYDDPGSASCQVGITSSGDCDLPRHLDHRPHGGARRPRHSSPASRRHQHPPRSETCGCTEVTSKGLCGAAP